MTADERRTAEAARQRGRGFFLLGLVAVCVVVPVLFFALMGRVVFPVLFVAAALVSVAAAIWQLASSRMP